MARQAISEELIEKLDFAGELELPGITSNLSPARPSSMNCVSSSSSLGRLGILPTELLSQTFHHLDFGSLARLSRVCLRAKITVEDLPAYKEMMDHAPKVLTALGETRIVRRHSAGLLRHTLWSSRCCSCDAFGAFLFPPTCERACLDCLEWNCGLRVTTPDVARECFGLTRAQAKKIRTMRSIPGRYGPIGGDYRMAYRLVAVKDANTLAIEVHGSAETVSKQWMEQEPGVSTRLFRLHKALVQAPISRLRSDERGRNRRFVIEDAYYGMASARFPSVTRAGVEHGRICRGCRFLLSLFYQKELPESVLEELGITAEETHVFRINASKLWSDREFREHVGTCCGVRLLLDRGEFTE